MAENKEPLTDLVPSDCVAINEIIDFAYELAKREKQEGWEKFEDANHCRTHLSRQLSSLVSGKLEKGCSWFDFAPDSAWVQIGKIDEVSLRVFKAAELYSHALNPGKGLHYHDTFACLVVACTSDPGIAEKVERVRKNALDSGVLDANRADFHGSAIEMLSDLNRDIKEEANG